MKDLARVGGQIASMSLGLGPIAKVFYKTDVFSDRKQIALEPENSR